MITKPIEEVALSEILLCPPDGTNTALNLDLMHAEEVELIEAQRVKLILVALKNLHNISINKFIEEQTMFHNPYSVFRVYAGVQQQSFAYTEPAFTFNNANCQLPDKGSEEEEEDAVLKWLDGYK